MEASCCCFDPYYGDGPSVSSIREPRARKEHRCCECGDTIQKGEVYELVNGCWDGSWSTFKTCVLCARIREDLAPCAIYGELQEHLQECLGFDYITGEFDGNR